MKSSAVQSSPSATWWFAPVAESEANGTAKWKITSDATTNSTIAGTVSLARSSSRRSLRASAPTSER